MQALLNANPLFKFGNKIDFRYINIEISIIVFQA